MKVEKNVREVRLQEKYMKKKIRSDLGEMQGYKSGSKMVQVKGVMPLGGGITRETPTGRAVGGFGVWHNF